jgi:hypothetical protein
MRPDKWLPITKAMVWKAYKLVKRKKAARRRCQERGFQKNLAAGPGKQPPSGQHAGHAYESVSGVLSASGKHLIDRWWACRGKLIV